MPADRQGLCLLQADAENTTSGGRRAWTALSTMGLGQGKDPVPSGHIGTEPHTRLRYFCSPHHQDSALYPFVAQLERAAGFTRDDTVEGSANCGAGRRACPWLGQLIPR